MSHPQQARGVRGAAGCGGRIDRRFLALLSVAIVLSLVAWQVATSWREVPQRTALTTYRSLMPDLRFAEFVRVTERLQIGGRLSQRYTLEADGLTGGSAEGMLSRPDASPPFAWLVGQRPGFFLDVIEPVDRTLALILAAGTDEPQEVTISLNGHELGRQRLRKDNAYMTLRVAAPSAVQVAGRNRVQLDFTRVQQRQVEGEAAPWPIVGRLRLARFLLPRDEELLAQGVAVSGTPAHARLMTIEEGERRLAGLVLPGGSSVRLALRLPETERVALHSLLTRLDLPLEMWALPDRDPPRLLLRVEPDDSGPGIVALDLSAWVGGHVQVEFRVPDGAGSVQLRGLSMMVPSAETGAGDEASESDMRFELETSPEPFLGRLDVLRDGPQPRLSWTEDGLCLELDLSTRRRQLFDLDADAGRTRDLSFTRPASAAWLYQELCRAVNDRESAEDWSVALRNLRVRQ